MQRFKDRADDKAEVSEALIETASREKLQEWLGRTASSDADDWEVAAADLELVPSEAEKEHMRARLRLLELGVTAPQLVLLNQTTTDEGMIKRVAATCTAKGWDLSALLKSISGHTVESRAVALSVVAKGEVTTTDAVVTLSANWTTTLTSRDDIEIAMLVSLIANKAVLVEGGTYKVPHMTGTQDTAFTFYANGMSKRRIDPEWHVHVTHKKELRRPGFKKKSDKLNVGPGTRRDTGAAESRTLYEACRAK